MLMHREAIITSHHEAIITSNNSITMRPTGAWQCYPSFFSTAGMVVLVPWPQLHVFKRLAFLLATKQNTYYKVMS